MSLSRIDSNSIATGAINAGDLADGSITTAKIEANVAIQFAAGAVGTPSISTVSDTNTGIFFPAADSVALATNGTAAVTVDAGQRTMFPTTIGVGGATPSTSGSGISFPATQSASTNANTLDDYEEGTWTPSYLPGSGSFTSITHQDQAGSYSKIGNRVWFQGRIRTSAITVGGASGALYIQGLPFTSINNASTGQNAGSISLSLAWGGDFPNAFFVETNATFFQLVYRSSVNGTTLNTEVADLGTGAAANLLFFSGCYDV